MPPDDPDRAAEEKADYAHEEQAEADDPVYRAAYGGYEPDWIIQPSGVSLAAWDRYVTSQPGSDEHKAAYLDMHREAKGNGFPGPDPDQSYLADHGYQTDADRSREPGAQTEPAADWWEPEDALRAAEPGPDAATWSPETVEAARRPMESPDAARRRLAERYPESAAPEGREPEAAAWPELDQAAARADQARAAERRAAAAEQTALRAGDGHAGSPAWERLRAARQSRLDAEAETYDRAARLQQEAAVETERETPDHLYGAPECAETDPETAHFGWSAAEPEDAGRSPLPRVLDAREASTELAPEAAGLPDGTPHADAFLAGRGWQAQGGVYQRTGTAQYEREAG